jgi:hypothetical protein
VRAGMHGQSGGRMTMPLCPTHQTPLQCPQCTGTAGGHVTSPRKAAAARANGKRGGRPHAGKLPSLPGRPNPQKLPSLP